MLAVNMTEVDKENIRGAEDSRDQESETVKGTTIMEEGG